MTRFHCFSHLKAAAAAAAAPCFIKLLTTTDKFNGGASWPKNCGLSHLKLRKELAKRHASNKIQLPNSSLDWQKRISSKVGAKFESGGAFSPLKCQRVALYALFQAPNPVTPYKSVYINVCSCVSFYFYLSRS